MTLVSQIIADSYRESNLIAVGKAPTADQITEALRRLQALVLSCLGNDAGYILEDWNIVSATSIVRPSSLPIPAADIASFTVKPNSRLICSLTGAVALALDAQPQDGQRLSVVDAAGNLSAFNLTLDPNGRKIEGSPTPLVLSTDDTAKQWFYRSDTANWVLIDTLVVGSEMPFPVDYDDYFVTMLAMRLNPRYGKAVAEATQARLQHQTAQITARYSQTRLTPTPPAEN